jgi:hypothetical protein
LDLDGVQLPFELWEMEAPLEPDATICIGGLGFTTARNRRTNALDSGDKNLFCIVRIGSAPLPRSSEDWGAVAALAESEDDGAASKKEEGEEKVFWEVQLDSSWLMFCDSDQRALETEYKVPRSMRPAGGLHINIRGVNYTIDIDALTQTNDDSGTARTIRRRVHREVELGSVMETHADMEDVEEAAATVDRSGFQGSIWEEFCSMSSTAEDHESSSEGFYRSFSFDAAADGGGGAASGGSATLLPPAMPMPPATIASMFKKVTS